MPDINENVNQLDIDIDSWLGAPGGDNIISQNEEKPKPNMFSSLKTDMSFLDDEPEAKKPEEKELDVEGKEVTKVENTDVNKLLDELNTEDEPDETGKSKGGRPKTEKSGLVEFFKKRIEDKELVVFDDFDESKQTLDEYLGGLNEKDIDELWKANIESIKTEIAEKTPTEFFESLPEELQVAAKYVADGGKDLKGLFQALAHVEQTRDLDPTEDTDQEVIVRQFLKTNDFGTDSEIEEEINSYKDLGVLAKKAGQFKPKLDKMQEQVVARTIADQEIKREQQEKASKAYVNNVFDALRTGEINGFKLDKTTQSKLYAGLVQPQYPSISGRPTNQLGHLLEKYQFVEPNYPLIAEALWLLSDPDEYRKSVGKVVKNETIEQTARKLKTAQQSSKSSGTTEELENKNGTRKIARPNKNFFKKI